MARLLNKDSKKSQKKSQTKKTAKKSLAETRRYGTKSNYTEETLSTAIQQIKEGKIGIRPAARIYNIPRSTLENKLANKHCGKVGRPFSFDLLIEKSFVDHALLLAEMGVPISTYDLREIAKGYLDAEGIKVPHFPKNRPGWDWVQGLLSRFKTLISNKLPNHISNIRYKVNEEQILAFFTEYEKNVKDLPPENVWNYDETGFHDIPAKKKVLVQRSVRNPELLMNTSKNCYTVLMCGNASGTFLPPYIIMKGKEKWTDWLKGGPPGSKLNVSDSGWIELSVFDDWFSGHLIPFVKDIPGKKLLIGDNMSAHISLASFKLAEEHNIKFIFLVPNSTHLLQPLDVGYFASLKSNWREELLNWRQTKSGKGNKALPKSLFAQILQKTLERGSQTASSCMVSGFRATGLYPCDKALVLSKLPRYAKTNQEIVEAVGREFQQFIVNARETNKGPVERPRKFCMPIKPGKAVSVEEVEAFYEQKLARELSKKSPRGGGRGRGRGARQNTRGNAQRSAPMIVESDPDEPAEVPNEENEIAVDGEMEVVTENGDALSGVDSAESSLTDLINSQLEDIDTDQLLEDLQPTFSGWDTFTNLIGG